MRQYQIQVVEYIDAIFCITLCHTIVTTKQIRIMQLIPINTFETKYLYSSGERNSNGSITFSLPILLATFFFWSVLNSTIIAAHFCLYRLFIWIHEIDDIFLHRKETSFTYRISNFNMFENSNRSIETFLNLTTRFVNKKNSKKNYQNFMIWSLLCKRPWS